KLTTCLFQDETSPINEYKQGRRYASLMKIPSPAHVAVATIPDEIANRIFHS
ncbi:4376_t:CDS:2, partial [Funneliformis caledonium]